MNAIKKTLRHGKRINSGWQTWEHTKHQLHIRVRTLSHSVDTRNWTSSLSRPRALSSMMEAEDDRPWRPNKHCRRMKGVRDSERWLDGQWRRTNYITMTSYLEEAQGMEEEEIKKRGGSWGSRRRRIRRERRSKEGVEKKRWRIKMRRIKRKIDRKKWNLKMH